ncbi:MAG: autotransporter outer membrane beta-barrel domain-containing protein [Betaproteobacteria bacterium]|nr:autotransporter outer membrane beta-barrel domain-containing protein [Betaproteobacteria bacterium]
MAFSTQTVHAQTNTFTISSSNASVGIMNLNAPQLWDAGSLSNLSVGSYPYKYATVSFVPSTSAIYTFGQTSAPVDTVMVLYQGSFNPASPKTGALVFNDDTYLSIHQSKTQNPSLSVNCGGGPDLCPQVASQVTAGQKYTVLVSTFDTGDQFDLPLSYYATGGQGTFSLDQPPPTVISAVSAAQATAVTSQVQRATTIQQAVTIINVLSSIGNPRAAMGPQRITLGQNKSGMAAGGGAEQWNAWINASRSQISNSYNQLADTRFDGDVDNWIGGLDYGLAKDLVIGASLGYDKTSIDTFFNNGSLTNKGVMIAPYISYQINSMFSLDGIIGFADGDSDIRLAAGKVTQDFKRNFAALNLSAVQWSDSWQFTGKLSLITAQEKLKDYVDALGVAISGKTNSMQQVRFGAQVGYWADGFMPYVGLTYSRDLSMASNSIAGVNIPRSREAYTPVVGINVFSKNLMGSLSYSSEQGRSNSKNDLLMASLGYRF